MGSTFRDYVVYCMMEVLMVGFKPAILFRECNLDRTNQSYHTAPGKIDNRVIPETFPNGVDVKTASCIVK